MNINKKMSLLAGCSIVIGGPRLGLFSYPDRRRIFKVRPFVYFHAQRVAVAEKRFAMLVQRVDISWLSLAQASDPSSHMLSRSTVGRRSLNLCDGLGPAHVASSVAERGLCTSLQAPVTTSALAVKRGATRSIRGSSPFCHALRAIVDA